MTAWEAVGIWLYRLAVGVLALVGAFALPGGRTDISLLLVAALWLGGVWVVVTRDNAERR